MALFTIGPWALFLIYDVVLYFWRAIAYEIPVVGGRARGRERPRAPSLTERPGGETRSLGIVKIPPLDGGEQIVHMEEEDAVDSSTRMRQSRTTTDTGD